MSDEPDTDGDVDTEPAPPPDPPAWGIGDDGKIDRAPLGVEYDYEVDKHFPVKIVPEVIVIHYAVTHSLAMTSAALRASDYVSAHLSIDGFTKDDRSVMQVAQHLPFIYRAGHAGPATWIDPTGSARTGVNNISIGIEIANPGPLIEHADGSLRTVYKRTWTDRPVTTAPHALNRAPSNWKHWARYTDQEYFLLMTLCQSLRQKYPTIVDVVGHDEIRKDKFDPGPAFNMAWLREQVLETATT